MKNSLSSFLFGTKLNDDKLLNIAWLIFRLHIGLSIAIHAGWPKVDGSSTPGWFVKQVGEIGFTFPTPEFWAIAATWGEFAGGLMLAAGLLTRFAALQLAFQFFVISFMWYDQPEFFTGMYFQQLLFWCYVLALFVGGGTYSLDRLIFQMKPRSASFSPKIALLTSLLLTAWSGVAQHSSFEQMTFPTPAQNAVTVKELKPYFGHWKGTLSYADYGTGRRTQIPATLKWSLATNGKTILAQYSYPEESSHNRTDTMDIFTDATMINGARIISKTRRSNELTIIAEKPGMDNDSTALLRFTYRLMAHRLSIKKEISRTGKDFFWRNEYLLTK